MATHIEPFFLKLKCKNPKNTLIFQKNNSAPLLELLRAAGLKMQEQDILILPPILFPRFEQKKILNAALRDVDYELDGEDRINKFRKRLLIRLVKEECTIMCAPVLLLGQKQEARKFINAAGNIDFEEILTGAIKQRIASLYELDSIEEVKFFSNKLTTAAQPLRTSDIQY